MSITIPIPGGQAVLREKLVTERHVRVVERAYLRAESAFRKILATQGIEGNTDPSVLALETDVDLEGISFSDSEIEALLAVKDALIIAFLESWTLPEPLPTMDTVQDLPKDLYDALMAGVEQVRGGIAEVPDFSPHPDQYDEKGEMRPTGSSSTSNNSSLGTSVQGLSETMNSKLSTVNIVSESYILD